MGNGADVDCAPLIIRLRVVLTQDVTSMSILGTPPPEAPVENAFLLAYCHSVRVECFQSLPVQL